LFKASNQRKHTKHAIIPAIFPRTLLETVLYTATVNNMANAN